MPGTFRSTDAATFVIPYPLRTSTTGSSAALAYASSFGTASSGFTCVISRPTGADLTFTLNSLPAGITWAYVGQNPVAGIRLNMASSLYTTAGIYHCSIIVTADLSYLGQTDNVQWGGWVDTAASATTAADAATAATQSTLAASRSLTASTQATTAATQSTTAATQATTAATQATLARKYAGNRYAANSNTSPNSLTIYEDDGVTPLGTRTIANANGSPINPAQILELGAVV
jgi:hypothetical protein